MNLIKQSILLGTCSLLATAASAEWSSVHLDGTNNAFVPVMSELTDAAASPIWSTGPQDLATNVRAILTPRTAVTVSDDTTTGSVGARLKAFDRTTGDLVWETDPLASRLFSSSSSPLLDEGRNALFFPSDDMFYRINASTGRVVWSTQFDGSTVDPGGSYSVVNSSPAQGPDGTIFIKTFFDAFTPGSQPSQIIALNPRNGNIMWSAPVGGSGTAAPLLVDLGALDLVVADTRDSESNGGLIALNAETGAVVWDHNSVEMPWDTGSTEFFTAPIFADGMILGTTYSFGGSGEFIAVDPRTGALIDSVPLFAADAPPVYDGEHVLVVGGSFGATRIAGLNPADLDGPKTGFNVPLGGGDLFTFRNYMAATMNQLYLTTSDGFGSTSPQLHVVDPQTGVVSSSSLLEQQRGGPVTVSDTGVVYVYNVGMGGLMALGTPLSQYGDVAGVTTITDVLAQSTNRRGTFDGLVTFGSSPPSPPVRTDADLLAQVGERGDVSGIVTLTVTDAEGFFLESIEVPLTGRVRYSTLLDIEIDPIASDENSTTVRQRVQHSDRIVMRGLARENRRSYGFQASLSRRLLQVMQDGRTISTDGSSALVGRIATVFESARGSSDVTLSAGEALAGAVLSPSRESLRARNSRQTAFSGDAVLYSDFRDRPQAGGSSVFNLSFYNVDAERPGSFSVNARNEGFYYRQIGFLLNTEEEVTSGPFDPTTLDVLSRIELFSAPASVSRTRIDWDRVLVDRDTQEIED